MMCNTQFILLLLSTLGRRGILVQSSSDHYAELKKKRTGRIVGGKEALRNRYPWMASLQAYRLGGAVVCGGTLVAPDMILTAAHCAENEKAQYVQMGKHDRQSSQEDENEQQSFIVVERISHEGFDDETFSNDIALLKVNGTFTLYQYMTLDIPNITTENADLYEGIEDDGYEVKENDDLVVMGWGHEAYEQSLLSDVLKEGIVQYKDNSACLDIYGHIDEPAGFFDPINQLCAQSSVGDDACHGDSGGPLVRLRGTASEDIQVGLVSWGIGCGSPDYPGVYTRISAYYEWINYKICEWSEHGCMTVLQNQMVNDEQPSTTNVIYGETTQPSIPLWDVALTSSTVTASSYWNSEYLPRRAIDGRSTTQWSSKSDYDNATYRIEFHTLYNITYFAYWNRPSLSDYVMNFTLYFSDGSNQLCLVNPTSVDELQYYNLGDTVQTTFIEWHANKGISPDGTSKDFIGKNVGAIQISAFINKPQALLGTATKPTNLGVNIAIDAFDTTVDASSYFRNMDVFHPNNAIDENNPNSEWASYMEGTNAYIDLYLGATYEVNYVAYQTRQNEYDQVNHFLLLFSDGSYQVCAMNENDILKIQYFDLRDGNTGQGKITDFIRFRVDVGSVNPGAIQLSAFTDPDAVIQGTITQPNNLGLNVALNADIEPSSYYQNLTKYQASNLLDDDEQTDWSSWAEGNHTYALIKFNTFHKLKYLSYQSRMAGVDYVYQFVVQFSNGGLQVCNLDDSMGMGYNNIIQKQYFELGESFDGPVETNSILFKVSNGGLNAGGYHFGAYIAPPSEILGVSTPPPNPKVNVAPLAINVKASSHYLNRDDFKPELAVDDNLTTRWASNGDGNDTYLIITLPQLYTIKNVGYKTRLGRGLVTKFMLIFSKSDDAGKVSSSSSQVFIMDYDNIPNTQVQYFDIDDVETSVVEFRVLQGGALSGAFEIMLFT